MSVLLVPPTEVWLKEMLPDLTAEELNNLKNIAKLMEEKIFIPILESKNREKTIERELDHYLVYLWQVVIPILPKWLEWRRKPEFAVKLYESLRAEIKEKVPDQYSLFLILPALNISEEHDRYTLDLMPNFGKFMALIEEAGPEVYLYALTKTSLALTSLLLAINRKPEAVRNLSRIAKKYADELEPFVATFQVFLEPELTPLRKKTSERNIAKAKNIRGSLFETVES